MCEVCHRCPAVVALASLPPLWQDSMFHAARAKPPPAKLETCQLRRGASKPSPHASEPKKDQRTLQKPGAPCSWSRAE